MMIVTKVTSQKIGNLKDKVVMDLGKKKLNKI